MNGYDLGGGIDRPLDSQDADQPKFSVGETVWIQPLVRWGTIYAITGNGDYSYHIDNVGGWGKGWLLSKKEREAQQTEIMAGIEARDQQDKEMRQHLEETKPERENYDTEAEYGWAYVQWAEGFWSCGGMTTSVRELYYAYMLSNRWTILS